jgi:polyhydroxyalkanoate synthesis regulator phasin
LALEAGLAELADEAARAAERVAEGRFYVACVGQFKRGKSTLLNALVGEPILPTGVVPVTSVVTVIRHGQERGARVRRAGGRWETIAPERLGEYVSEEGNPQNAKRVEAVEVFVPARLLESGMCLVDTPGLGSVFARATEATRAFIPHIDAALIVLGADPPLSGEELGLLEEVAGQVTTLVFVLNKADRLSEAERREARVFAERVLGSRLGRPAGPILEVSAAERLARSGPRRDWDALVACLSDLARGWGATLVRAAGERALARLAGRLLRSIDEQLGALQRPLEDTEQRLKSLHRTTAELERSLGDLGSLLTAEQDRLIEALRAERDRFVSRVLTEAPRALEEAVWSLGALPPAELRRRALGLAQDVARRHLDRWLEEQQPIAEAQYREAAQRFVELANGFLGRFTAARDLGLDHLPATLGAEAGFRVESRLFYTELLHLTTRSWLTWLLDRVRPRAAAVRAATREGGRYLERLLASNSARIQNDLVERVRESRRRLEAEIRSQLSEALARAEQALDRARARHAAGRQAVEGEVERLEALRRRVEALAAGR